MAAAVAAVADFISLFPRAPHAIRRSRRMIEARGRIPLSSLAHAPDVAHVQHWMRRVIPIRVFNSGMFMARHSR